MQHSSRSSKKSLLKPILVGLTIFVLGGLLVAYPFIADYLAALERAKVVNVQRDVIEQVEDTTLADELQRAYAYNEQVRNGLTIVSDPFDPEYATVADQEYMGLLNLGGDGVMGTIQIPAIGVNTPIYHGVAEEELQHGAGHMPGTSLPVGGPSTHAGLAGHTGLPSTKIFDSVDQLVVGDYFFIDIMGEVHAYQVDNVDVVLPEQTEGLAIEDGRDLVTLITCTPYGVNSHRLLVRGARCEVPPGWLEEDGTLAASVFSGETRESPEIFKNTMQGVATGLAVVVAGWTVVGIVSRVRRALGKKGVSAGGAAGASRDGADEGRRRARGGRRRADDRQVRADDGRGRGAESRGRGESGWGHVDEGRRHVDEDAARTRDDAWEAAGVQVARGRRGAQEAQNREVAVQGEEPLSRGRHFAPTSNLRSLPQIDDKPAGGSHFAKKGR